MKTNINPRFILLVGAIHEAYPDVPEQTGSDGSIMLWDRQEKKPVVTLHPDYAQAMVWELTDKPENAPFSNLERWFNSLDNETLASENLKQTEERFRPAKPEAVESDEYLATKNGVIAAIRRVGIWASLEHPDYVSVPIDGKSEWAFGNDNELWSGNVNRQDGETDGRFACLNIASDSKDVQAIADAIVKVITSDKGAA